MVKRRSGKRNGFVLKRVLAHRLRASWKTLTVLFLGVFFFVGIFGASFVFAVQSNLFMLRRVLVENDRRFSGKEAFQFTGLRPFVPLLSVDLKGVESRLRADYPEYKGVLVRRVLPDQVYVQLRRRDPIAQIQHGLYYLLDRDGMVVSEPLQDPHPDFPLIHGVTVPGGALKPGSRIDRRSVGQAIQVLQEIRQLKALHPHRLTAIDTSDRNNFVLMLDGQIEVRVSANDFEGQLRKLSDALAHLDLEPKRVRYIDLRFEDIVVGPR